MKKKKSLRLTLNKKKISELSSVSQQKIVGGTYAAMCGGGFPKPGTYGCTTCAYTCSC